MTDSQDFADCPMLVRLPGEVIKPPMEVIHILGINVTDKPFYQIRLLLCDKEEAQSFISSEHSKPVVTIAILKCAAQSIFQVIGPHEEFLTSPVHNSYHIQVIAMENYLDHQAPVHQGPPPQDPNTCTGARTKGPPPSPAGADYAPCGFMGDWCRFIPVLISKSHHLLVH